MVDDTGKTTVVATGILNADGTFSLTLPATVADASLSTIGSALDLEESPLLPSGLSCTAALVPSDTSARDSALLVAVAGQKTGAVSPVVQSGQLDETAQTGTINTRSGGYVYSDRAVSISGTQTCTGSYQGVAVKATLNSAVQLAQGWNTVSVVSDIRIDNSGVTLTTTSQTGALPTNQWLYSSGDLGGLSLPRLPLPLRR